MSTVDRKEYLIEREQGFGAPPKRCPAILRYSFKIESHRLRILTARSNILCFQNRRDVKGFYSNERDIAYSRAKESLTIHFSIYIFDN